MANSEIDCCYPWVKAPHNPSNSTYKEGIKTSGKEILGRQCFVFIPRILACSLQGIWNWMWCAMPLGMLRLYEISGLPPILSIGYFANKRTGLRPCILPIQIKWRRSKIDLTPPNQAMGHRDDSHGSDFPPVIIKARHSVSSLEGIMKLTDGHKAIRIPRPIKAE